MIERELRFLLSDNQYLTFKRILINDKEKYKFGNCQKETTIMYDNPNPEFSFYDKKIDGRLRLRISKKAKSDFWDNNLSFQTKSMLTWKQRIPEIHSNDVRVEKEIEVNISDNDINNIKDILEKVLRCTKVSSYERIRETLYTEYVEIAVDKFPYGHVVELELKKGDDDNILIELANNLELFSTTVSRLSCDDLYKLLCKKANVTPKSDILFSDESMPCLNDYLPLKELENK